jgi:hypothetical protein
MLSSQLAPIKYEKNYEKYIDCLFHPRPFLTPHNPNAHLVKSSIHLQILCIDIIIVIKKKKQKSYKIPKSFTNHFCLFEIIFQ